MTEITVGIAGLVAFFIGCLLLSITQCRVYWDENEEAKKKDFCGLFARMRAKRFAKIVHGDVYEKSVARGRGFSVRAWVLVVQYSISITNEIKDDITTKLYEDYRRRVMYQERVCPECGSLLGKHRPNPDQPEKCLVCETFVEENK